MAAGVVYAALGAIVLLTGSGWVQRLMPPPVTGAVGAAIGLNLAPVAMPDAQGSGAQVLVAMGTALATALAAVYAPRRLRRLSILIGIGAGWLLYLLLSSIGFSLPPISLSEIATSSWFGLPRFQTPVFNPSAIGLMAPVALVLVAENLGHIKAIGAMTGRGLDRFIGRAFIGDALATIVAASSGGTGVTTYVENMGVMAVT